MNQLIEEYLLEESRENHYNTKHPKNRVHLEEIK